MIAITRSAKIPKIVESGWTTYKPDRHGSFLIKECVFKFWQCWQSVYTPIISPLSFTSMPTARETFGNPGMSIMFPEITTTNPAPAESEASVTFSVQPVGAPRSLGLSLNEYCVLAIQTGSLPKHQSLNCCSLVRAFSLKLTPAAP